MSQNIKQKRLSEQERFYFNQILDEFEISANALQAKKCLYSQSYQDIYREFVANRDIVLSLQNSFAIYTGKDIKHHFKTPASAYGFLLTLYSQSVDRPIRRTFAETCKRINIYLLPSIK